MESPSPGYRHRVLVLAYYFPPMGGSGVQRTAKFVKYLPMYGWEPVVLTAEPGGYYAFDETLQAEMERAGIEVRRTSSFDPNRLLGKERTVPMPGEVGRKLFSGLSQMFFVPDNKKGWAEPAFEAGKKLLEMRRFDAIFSTAPPYTSHLVGMRLSKAFGLPLITDFRDDWVGNPRHRYPTPWHRKRHEALEREVLQYSAAAVTINRAIQGNLARRTLGASGLKKVHVIPQGYDLDDFTQATPAPARSEVMRLLYAGLFYDAQKPNTFLKGLADLLERRPDIRPRIEAKFVGMLPKKGQQLIAKLKLEDVTVVDTYRPHLETVGELLSADVLWMTVGHQKAEETISTG
ncbi:MAG: glycosyltransferase, partial [Bacteroidota bacterium]